MSRSSGAVSVGQARLAFDKIGAMTETPFKSSSVTPRPKPELRKPTPCSRCGRVVERVDAEFEQCVRCNADEIREAGRITLVESLPPEQARIYAADVERQLLHLEIDLGDVWRAA